MCVCVCVWASGEGSNVYVDSWTSLILVPSAHFSRELILELHFLTTVDRKKIVVCSI